MVVIAKEIPLVPLVLHPLIFYRILTVSSVLIHFI